MGRKSKATLEAEAAAAVPAGHVLLRAPEGVTAVSGYAVVDGEVVVPADVAETLMRMHGFVRG